MKKTIEKLRRKSNNDLCTTYQSNFFTLHIDIYNTDIILYCGKEKKLIQSINRYVKRKYKSDGEIIIQKLQNYIGSDDNTSPYWCMHIDELKHNKIILICCEDIDIDDIDGLCTLIHECLHAALEIHDYHNIKNDNCGFESLVYLHEYILGQFLTIIKKHQRKIKK